MAGAAGPGSGCHWAHVPWTQQSCLMLHISTVPLSCTVSVQAVAAVPVCTSGLSLCTHECEGCQVVGSARVGVLVLKPDLVAHGAHACLGSAAGHRDHVIKLLQELQA